MSSEDAPQCAYCSRFGHHAEECAAARGDRRIEAAIGWLAMVVMVPFAGAGFLGGLIVSGFMGGFRASSRMWAKTMKTLFSKETPQ